MTRRVLIVGGTGVLRRAAEHLARSAQVVITSRTPGLVGPSARRLVADTTQPFTRLPGTWGASLVYQPAVHPAVLQSIAAATAGPVVLVVPSAVVLDVGGIAQLAARAGAVLVTLGWTGLEHAPRWHTRTEIAAATLTALNEHRPVLLGRLSGRRPA